MRVGLVLGAGGTTGAAYLTGALTALAYDAGWDPRNAEVIVGTSAGSLVGALLRSDVSPADLAAWTTGARISEQGNVVLRDLDHGHLDPVALWEFLRMPRLPRPSAIAAALRRPRRFDPIRSLMLHIADGTRSAEPLTAFLGNGWPDRPYACCAVRRSDGHRTVFGPGQPPTAGLATAVAASCAVPGYFAPVVVDGERYLDGGIASTTNADVLVTSGLDVVLTIAPMASAERGRGLVERVTRRQVRSALDAERTRLERAGVRTFVLAPGPETVALLTGDFMSDEFTVEILQRAFLETGQQAQATGLLDVLRDAPAAA